MATKEQRAEYMKLQMEVAKGWISYWHADVISGNYKTRIVLRGCLTDSETPIRLTELELLKDSMDTLRRHVERLSELTDNYNTLVTEKENYYEI